MNLSKAVKLILSIQLLLMGSISFANETATSQPATTDVPKVSVTKLKTREVKGRTIGGSIPSTPSVKNPKADEISLLKKRMQELEELVEEQQKLLDLYKAQLDSYKAQLDLYKTQLPTKEDTVQK